VSADRRRKITCYDPVEDFRNLSVMSRFDPDARVMNAGKDLRVSKCETGPAAEHGESKDDLFASDYDIVELLENLTVRPGFIPAVQTPS
jgi:hypothetical protein